MKANLQSVLRDPVTHDSLETVLDTGPGGIARECLVNEKTGVAFPVRGGIPFFLEDSDVSGSNKTFQAMYDRLARFYDVPYKLGYYLTRKSFLRKVREVWRGELEVREDDRVLEVSIGTGFNRRYFPQDVSYYGLDISPGMLRQCRRNMKRWGLQAALVRGNAECLPFADGAFDVVFHVGGINFFNDKDGAIREMIRVARPGTRIVISDETEKFMKFYNAIPMLRKVTKKISEPVVPPVDLIPTEMLEVRFEEKWKGRFYCISFTKPR